MDKNIKMVKNIAEKVNDLGGRTFFVGGLVRDKLINKDNKDIDIEIHNISSDKLRDILDSLGTVKTQGISFGVFTLQGFDIDIAQPRMENVTGRGHKDFEVTVDPFIGFEKAAKRRDFTINSIMEDCISHEIIDPFNGVEDLKNGIIRHVDDDSFGEDPLRVLRAAQFAARFGFDIAPETKSIMSKMDLSSLSSERIFEEVKKGILKSNKPSIFFEVLRDVNQLDHWFPELKNLIGCEQNAKFHPEGDAWTHTMTVLDNAAIIKNETSNPEFFMMSALCHDLGKPAAFSKDDNGIIHNNGHETLGIDIAKTFVSRLTNNVAINKFVCDMVKNHMRPLNAFNSNSKAKKTNQIFDQSINARDLVKLSICDNSSKGNIDNINKEKEFLEERLTIFEARIKEPEVLGKDLIELGIKPSPIFTIILADAHKKHLSFVDKETVLKDIKKRFETT